MLRRREDFRPLEIEAQLEVPAAHVMIARINHDGPDRHTFRRDRVYWLDLCLTPRRNGDAGRYSDHWHPSRLVPLGPLVAFPPRKRLDLRSGGGDHGSLICQLKAEMVDRWLPDDFVWTERRLEVSLNITNDSIKALMLKLNHELRNGGVGSVAFCEAVLAELAIELARHLLAASHADEKGGLASWRQRIIDERVAKAGVAFPTVAELAALCKMSPRQLSRAFRTSRGCSVSDYLVQTRIEVAKRRLCTKDSIRDIAAQLGFSSQSSFTAAFRRSTGATPNNFRQRVALGRDA